VKWRTLREKFAMAYFGFSANKCDYCAPLALPWVDYLRVLASQFLPVLIEVCQCYSFLICLQQTFQIFRLGFQDPKSPFGYAVVVQSIGLIYLSFCYCLILIWSTSKDSQVIEGYGAKCSLRKGRDSAFFLASQCPHRVGQRGRYRLQYMMYITV